MANDRVLRTYDPKAYVITFLGNPVTNFADGTFLDITSEDTFEAREGADGSEDRINKNRNGVDVSITIMNTSITNDVLTTQFEIDKNTNNGKGALLIKDLNGTTVLFSEQAYIKKKADKSLGDSAGSSTWTLRAPQATYIHGGNL